MRINDFLPSKKTSWIFLRPPDVHFFGPCGGDNRVVIPTCFPCEGVKEPAATKQSTKHHQKMVAVGKCMNFQSFKGVTSHFETPHCEAMSVFQSTLLKLTAKAPESRSFERERIVSQAPFFSGRCCFRESYGLWWTFDVTTKEKMSHGPVMSMAIQRRPSLGRRVSDLRAVLGDEQMSK